MEEQSIPQPRKNQTRMQSDENLKTFVEAWLARPKNARMSSTLLPTAKEKEEIIQGCGVDKKRLESLFYRMRKKPKQKRWGCCCCYWWKCFCYSSAVPPQRAAAAPTCF